MPEGTFSERLRRLTAKVGEAKREAETAAAPEEVKRRKLEVLRRRKLQEKRQQREQAVKDAAKTKGERDAEVVLHCVKAGILDWKLREVTLRPKPISDGLHYRTWVLDVSGEGAFAVRDLVDAAEPLRSATGFNQAREYAFQAACGRSGIGFLTPHHITDQGCLILSRYDRTARKCEPQFIRDRFRQVVDLIKRLHGMETTGLQSFFPANCFSDVEDLARCAKSRELPLPENFSALYQIVMQWRDLLGQNPVERQREYVVCHNDLRASNLMHVPSDSSDPREKAGRLCLVDFVDAGLGDRYWDLAQFSRLNSFSNDEDVLLMKYYFGTYRENQMAVLKLLQAVGDFRQALWCTVAAALMPADPRAAGAWPGEAVTRMQRFEKRAMDRDFAMYIGQELCR